MAEFNQCSGLMTDEEYSTYSDMYDKLLLEGTDPTQILLNLQNDLQVNLVSKLPERNIKPEDVKTRGELVDWLRKQKDCVDDEFRELLNSIGGMSNGEKAASSVWKDWKAQNVEMRSMTVDSLSSEDKLEMLFEMIDIMHFINNMIIGMGMTAKDVFILYCLKNKENFNRHNNSY